MFLNVQHKIWTKIWFKLDIRVQNKWLNISFVPHCTRPNFIHNLKWVLLLFLYLIIPQHRIFVLFIFTMETINKRIELSAHRKENNLSILKRNIIILSGSKHWKRNSFSSCCAFLEKKFASHIKFEKMYFPSFSSPKKRSSKILNIFWMKSSFWNIILNARPNDPRFICCIKRTPIHINSQRKMIVVNTSSFAENRTNSSTNIVDLWYERNNWSFKNCKKLHFCLFY